MEKSSASSQSQRPSAGQRVQLITSTPRPEIMTPPTPQSMLSPIAGTSQPTETSVGSAYQMILEDVMGRFSPSGKMSEVFAQLAKKFKNEVEQLTPIPIGIPTGAPIQTDPAAARTLVALTTSQTHSPATESPRFTDNREEKAEFEEEVKSSEGGNGREEEKGGEGMDEEVKRPDEEKSTGQNKEVVNVDEERSKDDRETLDERAIRRNLTTRRGLERDELISLREEAAVLLAAKREAAERKRKGKQVAPPARAGNQDQLHWV